MIAVALATTGREARADVVQISQVSGRQFTDLNGGSPDDGTLSGEFPASALVSQIVSGGVTHRFGFEFPLSAIPPGATVTSAVFAAGETFDSGGGSAIYGRAGDGVVGQNDLFDFSNLLANELSGAGDGTSGSVSFNLTAFVQNLVVANQSYLALAFSPGTTSVNGEYRIANFDGAGSNVDPLLTVTYTATVPEVGAWKLILLAAGITLGATSRRLVGVACRSAT